jgi:regulator of protease activity HflC (stomatin/prohibitin superfamily)
MNGIIIGIVALAILAVILLKCVKVIKQGEVGIVERLGKYKKTIDAGPHLILPFIENVKTVIVKELTMDVPPQNVITKDNVTISIDTVVFYIITDPTKAVYAINDLRRSIQYMAQTTVRNIVGKMELEEILASRDTINSQLRESLDIATDPWGCKVNNVEIKDIVPPRDVKEAMEKLITADRTKRSSISLAEGEKESAIRIAEGQRESRILEADAEKESRIKKAEGLRQSRILEATGEAEAIERIAQAKAKELELEYAALKNAGLDDRMIAVKSLEALEKASEGSANKIFIPFDATKTLGAIGSIKDVLKD